MFLIHESRNVTLKEKHKAYLQLIEQYPSYALAERRYEFFKGETVDTFLRKVIDRENKLIAECKRNGDDAIYFAEYYSSGDDAWMRSDLVDPIYHSFQECFSDTLKNGEDDIVKLKITKKYFADNRRVDLKLLPNGSALSVSCSEVDDPTLNAFEWMWINVPTPFERGDIVRPVREKVWNSRRHSDDEDVMVLTEMCTWGSKEFMQNGYKNATGAYKVNEINFKSADKLIDAHTKYGDVTDMLAHGYFVGESDNVYHDHMSAFATYLDFEYYTEELNGKRRILKAISSFLKGEIYLDLLLTAYKIINLEDNLRETKQYSTDYLDDDTLKLLGLKH